MRTNYRANEAEPTDLVTFFLITFTWSWFWRSLFIGGMLHMPVGVGTPEMEALQLNPIILIVLISTFGPTFAGFLMTARSLGREAVRAPWKRLWNLNLS